MMQEMKASRLPSPGRITVLGLLALTMFAGLMSLPHSEAVSNVQTDWSGYAMASAYCGSSNEVSSNSGQVGSMTVYWSVSWSPSAGLFYWQYSTSYSWDSDCSWYEDSGTLCIGPLTDLESGVLDDSGSQPSAPDFTVYPGLSVVANINCGGVYSTTFSVSMQAAVNIQT